MHFGIDYGSKLAGTTVICFDLEGHLHVVQSEKKKDADAMILERSLALRPQLIALDAPLSLPPAYFDLGDDFFYRTCDRELRAMSPMFLGGLTARAMRIQKILQGEGIAVIETYPAQFVKELLDKTPLYQKKSKELKGFLHLLSSRLPYPLANQAQNWHQVDAILAWYSGYRFIQKKAIPYGEKAEGLIWI
jgi:predicted nuclease with RNAse H fold